MKIVADKDIPFLKGVLEPFGQVVYLPGEAISPEDVHDADVLLVRTRTRCDEVLLRGSRVKFIGTATVGFDHIDTLFCGDRGIRVATAAGCNSRAVLQWAAAALGFLKIEPSETSLGVVGVGNIGSLVKKYAEHWGFRVLCSDPPRGLDDDISVCDILTFHVPLTFEGPCPTHNMVDSQFASRLKPNAVIINSSRGGVVDEKSLAGRKYILDVFNHEPDIDRQILSGALLATPHIAGYSIEGKQAATQMILRELVDFFNDKSLYRFSALLQQRITNYKKNEKMISWEDMCRQMPRYFDIAAQSASLKSAPEKFEEFRNNYKYREEFF